MSPKDLWKKLYKKISLSYGAKETGRLLFVEYTKKGYLTDLTPLDNLDVLIDFYKRLTLVRPMGSPINRRHDDRWMGGADIQYFSVAQSGSFVTALKDILLCRVDSLILLPVTEHKEQYPLYPLSHSLIDQKLGDERLLEWGFSIQDQFNLFLGALHLCQIRVGYYLSPLVCDEAAVLYRRPDLFLWCDQKTQQPLFSDIVKGEIDQIVSQVGSYHYPQLKEQLRQRGMMPVALEHSNEMTRGLALFDLYNDDTQLYFSNVFVNLQGQFPLDFYYMDYPDALNSTYIERGTLSLITQAQRALKRYTAKVYTTYLEDAPTAPGLRLLEKNLQSLLLSGTLLACGLICYRRLLKKRRALFVSP